MFAPRYFAGTYWAGRYFAKGNSGTVLTSAVGAFSLSGIGAAFLLNSAPTPVPVIRFAVSGQNASLFSGSRILTGAGVGYSFIGQTANLLRFAKILSSNTGTFVLAGKTIAAVRDRKFSVFSGKFVTAHRFVGVSLSLSALHDLTVQECNEPWLVLLIIAHELSPITLLFTSDTVDTNVSGTIFTPYPFRLALPSSAEGRVPTARLILDNTSQELIAILRSIDTPPFVTIRIVRASTPDIIEKEFSGARLISESYDAGTITCQLLPAPLESERFPFRRFDRQFPGVWPS